MKLQTNSNLMFEILLTVVFISLEINAKNLVCYYYNKSPSDTFGPFSPSQINPYLCTHYVYGFAKVDPSNYEMTVGSSTDDIGNGGYGNFTALKQKNPNAKFLVALAGPDESTSRSTDYSKLVGSTTNIGTFVTSVVKFMKTYNFDGISLDWYYPNATDKDGYTLLISALKTAFVQNGSYLLGATVAALPAMIDAGYNVTALNQYLDFVNLRTFNYHDPVSEPQLARHPAPLYTPVNDPTMATTNVNYTVNYWLQKNLNASLINLGIAFYGNSWFFFSGTSVIPPVSASGKGFESLNGYSLPGFMKYTDVCTRLNSSNWAIARDPNNNTGPYSHSQSPPYISWVGYDDANMCATKVNYALSKNLGGVMVFDLASDDFANKCNGGISPLLTTISSILFPPPSPSTTSSTTYGNLTTSSNITGTPANVTGTYGNFTTSPSNTTGNPANITVTPAPNPSNVTTTRMIEPTTKSGTVCKSPNAVLSDPSSCKNFFICLEGIPYVTTCQLGTYFNPVSSRCEEDLFNTKCPTNGSKNETKKSESLSYNAVKYDWKVVY